LGTRYLNASRVVAEEKKLAEIRLGGKA
jgi:hypothetical protein